MSQQQEATTHTEFEAAIADIIYIYYVYLIHIDTTTILCENFGVIPDDDDDRW